MEAQFWLNLQTHYDMEVGMDALEARLDKEVHAFSRAAEDFAEPLAAADEPGGIAPFLLKL
jgi:plasmid maintenance system antidote protein VapI